MFKTTVKKKTLFPIWNEGVTLELPDDSNATLELVSPYSCLAGDDLITTDGRSGDIMYVNTKRAIQV